jgi:hypothetical protein
MWLLQGRCCRPQFGLRAIFVLTALASVPLGVHAYRQRQYRLRVAALRVLAEGQVMASVPDSGSPDGFRNCDVYIKPDDVVTGLGVGIIFR